MLIVLYIIILMLVLIILVLALILFRFSKNYFNDYDKKLILFVIDMYLLYGETNNIFPNNESKNTLLNKINILKSKIEHDTNYEKRNNET